MGDTMFTSVLEMFDGIVADHGGAVALHAREGVLNYAELDARANRVARLLTAEGVGRGDIVPLVLDRSIEYVVALLAVVKAGAAYLPLHPDMPSQRFQQILEFVGAKGCFCDAATEPRVVAHGVPAINLAELGDQLDYLSAAAPRLDLQGDDFAYMIYTSGSTGTPKGVPVAHDGFAIRMRDMTARYGFRDGDRCTFNAGVAFDASVFEIWTALLSGATLYIPPEDIKLSPSAYCGYMAEHGISISFLPTALMELLFLHWGTSPTPLPSLKLMVAGGERLKRRPPAGFPCAVENVYGPSETTIIVSSGVVAPVGAEDGLPHIGKALSSCRLYLLDEELNPVPQGEEGQLWIGGDGLSPGYFRQPDLTARSFRSDPFASDPAARMYASGDRCRIDEHGNLHFIGRLDDQVKIRGYRIELGEIEAALLSNHAVQAASAQVYRSSADAADAIVAHVVQSPGAGIGEAELRNHLAAQLPAYMVPARIVCMDAFPLNASGKVDKRALPMPEHRAPASAGDGIAQDADIVAVLELFRDTLGHDDIGPEGDFFGCGGNSIAAIQLLERVNGQFGTKVTFKCFFDAPTAVAVADEIRRGAGTALPAAPVVAHAGGGGQRLPLSSHQRAIWLEVEKQGYSKAYHFKALIKLRGALDVAALECTLSAIYADHEIYRAAIEVVNGEAWQVVKAPWAISLDLTDLRQIGEPAALRQAEALLDGAINHEFDISVSPLARMQLVALADDLHALLVVEHHLVHDGWSFNVFLRELFEGYKAEVTGAPRPRPRAPGGRYTDYALLQQGWLQSEEACRQVDFWRARLDGANAELNLPHHGRRGRDTVRHDGCRRIMLDRDLWRRCEAFCRRHNITTYVYTVATMKLVLARYANQREVLIGAPFANRNWAGFHDTIGMFVNPVALRDDVDQDLEWADFLAQVRDTVLEAHDHQELPFDEVVRAIQPHRTTAMNAFYQVMLGFHDSPFPTTRIPGLDVQVTEGYTSHACKLDMTWVFVPRLRGDGSGDPVHIVCEYRTDLFDAAFVDSFMESFVGAFRDGLQDEHRPMRALDAVSGTPGSVSGARLPAAERVVLPTLHALVAETSARHPDAPAIDDGRVQLSYRELDTRSDRLAAELVARGAGGRIGLLLPAAADALVAIVSVLKTGGAYVPLDPELPPARLAFIASDAGLALVLTGGGLAPQLPAGVVALDLDSFGWDALPAPFVPPPRTADDPAYVIYTSGSAGTPKGVEVPHRGVVNMVREMDRLAPLSPGARMTLLAKLGFDVSVYEIFAALATGACVMPVPESLRADDAGYFEWLVAQRITAAWVPPFFVKSLQQWAEAHAGTLVLERVLVGVEPLVEHQLVALRRAVPGLRVVNGYGPTETTICSTFYAVPEHPPEDAVRNAPIGRALPDTHLYVVDAWNNLCPRGTTGELLIGGVGVSLGYLNRPELTASAFVRNPFTDDPEDVLYRTGDLVRQDESGDLHFVGRADDQVKVRGYRIELSEIEGALRAHQAVAQATVAVRVPEGDAAFLVGYVVPSRPVEPAELSAFVAQHLPEYMVPNLFVMLECLPLTVNGKVDRRALPPPIAAAETFCNPRDDVEAWLVDCYCDLLKVQRVSIDHSFFDYGGHSLMAMKLITQVFTEYGLHLKLRDIMYAPTPAELAALVRARLALRARPEQDGADEEAFTF
jgi:amino acid adenylation domain-containing protein